MVYQDDSPDLTVKSHRIRIVQTDGGFYPPRADDARLIAAAPDLLYALQLTQRTTSGSFADGWTIQLTGHEMNAIREAIEKATEGTS